MCYLEDYLKYLKDNPSLDDDCKEYNDKADVSSTLDRLVKYGCAVIIKDFKGEIFEYEGIKLRVTKISYYEIVMDVILIQKNIVQKMVM